MPGHLIMLDQKRNARARARVDFDRRVLYESEVKKRVQDACAVWFFLGLVVGTLLYVWLG